MTAALDGLEGRVLAQRQILARLIHGQGGDLTEWLREKSILQIAEEDPGVGQGSGPFAIEASLADEMRLVLELVEQLDRTSAK